MQLNLLRLPLRHEEGQGEGGREVMFLHMILILSDTHSFEWMLFRSFCQTCFGYLLVEVLFRSLVLGYE